MTIEVALKIVKVKGEKVKYVVKCLAFELYTEGDTVGVPFAAMVKKLAGIAQGVHLLIKMEDMQETDASVEGAKDDERGV